MPRVLVSSGHTTKDPGTIVNGVREVDLNRTIAREVTTLLRKNNILTVAVPPDLDLVKRIEWINQMGYDVSKGDIVIEVHINDGGKQGVEGWYKANDEKSRNLTTKLVNNISKQVNWPSQGVRSEYEHPMGSLAFLHNTNPISSLLECGYMDNPNDLKILTSQDGIIKIAQGIVDGILEFFNIKQNTAQINTATTTNKITLNNQIGSNVNQVNAQVQKDYTQKQIDQTNKSQANTVQPKSNLNSNVQNTKQFATTSSAQTQTNVLNTSNTVIKPSAPTNTWQNTSTSTNMSSQNSLTNFNSTISGSNSNGFGPTANTSNNTFNTFQNAGFNSNSTTAFGSNNKFMTREERKEMIKKNYVKILGREPTQSDLNYFLNISIKEDDLIKRMVDSQEHADLVKARQEVIKIKEKFGKQKDELLRLRVKVSDQEGIIKNLNALLMQKNRVIYQLKQRLQYFNNIKRDKQESIKKKSLYKKTFKEKILDFFSDNLGK